MHDHKGALWGRGEISSGKVLEGLTAGREARGDFSHTHEPHTFGRDRARTPAIALRESLHRMIWRNRFLPRKDSWLPQHAYILPPSSRLGTFFYFAVCFLLSARPRIRPAARPRGHSRCSLFLASFAPSSIKISFAGRKYFVSYGMSRRKSPDVWTIFFTFHVKILYNTNFSINHIHIFIELYNFIFI